ncbi:MAG: AI-2E family transporter [Planctomycetia bacterium]|nr:AI-2E family transporter [Planctomycetia bacterium]
MASDWQRALVALAATVVTLAIVAVLYWARSIFIPVALATFLAFVLGPVVAWLQRRGLGRTLAVCSAVGLVAIVSVGVGAVVTHQLGSLADTLPDRREAIKAKLTSAKEWIVGDGNNRFGVLIDDVTEIMGTRRSQTGTVVVQSDSSWVSRVQDYISPAAELLGQAAFAGILTVFMLLRKEDLRNRMIRLLGDGKVTTTTKAVDDASRRISRYLLAQLILNTLFGGVIVIGLFLLGVKYALLWGFIATLMRYVPYVGTWIGLIPPTLFSLAMSEGWAQPIAVLALFVGLELLCNNIFEPMLYGQSMGLSEVAQLIAAAVWAFLWGPVGLILSGPLTVCLLVLGRHVRRFDFFVVLLGDQPALEPRVAFYQRLAARDQDEAAMVALEEAQKNGPEPAFDTVLIPALCLARRDFDEGDLDVADLRFVVRATREIAEEVAELRAPTNGKFEERPRLLISPARDEAEHVAAELLALTLDPAKWEVKVAADETLASEVVELAAEFRPDVVLITTLPPGGLSHARYLMTRLRSRFPDLTLMVGRWGCSEESVEARTNEVLKHSDGVDNTLAETRQRLSTLYPLLTAEGARVPTGEKNQQLVGTPSA